MKIKEVDKKFWCIIKIDKGEIQKISSINFIGDKIRNNRLRNIIASEKDYFWKFYLEILGLVKIL